MHGSYLERTATLIEKKKGIALFQVGGINRWPKSQTSCPVVKWLEINEKCEVSGKSQCGTNERLL